MLCCAAVTGINSRWVLGALVCGGRDGLQFLGPKVDCTSSKQEISKKELEARGDGDDDAMLMSRSWSPCVLLSLAR